MSNQGRLVIKELSWRLVFMNANGLVVGLAAVCVSRWRGFCKVPVDGRMFSRHGEIVQSLSMGTYGPQKSNLLKD